MDMRGLREVTSEDLQIAEEEEASLAKDEAKNGEVCAELVQCLDNKTIVCLLVMRDARDD